MALCVLVHSEDGKHWVIDHEIDGVLSPVIEACHAGTLLNCFDQFRRREL
jgi:hypothetical protein